MAPTTAEVMAARTIASGRSDRRSLPVTKKPMHQCVDHGDRRAFGGGEGAADDAADDDDRHHEDDDRALEFTHRPRAARTALAGQRKIARARR